MSETIWGKSQGIQTHVFCKTFASPTIGNHVFYNTFASPTIGNHVFYKTFASPTMGNHVFYDTFAFPTIGNHVFYGTFAASRHMSESASWPTEIPDSTGLKNGAFQYYNLI